MERTDPRNSTSSNDTAPGFLDALSLTGNFWLVRFGKSTLLLVTICLNQG